MTIDLDALEKLADAATPGPWISETGTDTVWIGPSKAKAAKVARIVCPIEIGPGYRTEYVDQQTANAAFIAAANPATIKALIAELKEARELMEPFAAMAEAGDQRPKDDAVWAGQDGKALKYGDFRAARAFLSKAQGGE